MALAHGMNVRTGLVINTGRQELVLPGVGWCWLMLQRRSTRENKRIHILVFLWISGCLGDVSLETSFEINPDCQLQLHHGFGESSV